MWTVAALAARSPVSYLSPELLESPLLPVVQLPDRRVPGILKVGKGLLRDLARPHLFLRLEAQAQQRKPQGRWSRLRSRRCLPLVESPVDGPFAFPHLWGKQARCFGQSA